jgi:hypothetical protein
MKKYLTRLTNSSLSILVILLHLMVEYAIKKSTSAHINILYKTT